LAFVDYAVWVANMSVVFIEKTLVKSIAIEQQKKHVYMDCGTTKMLVRGANRCMTNASNDGGFLLRLT